MERMCEIVLLKDKIPNWIELNKKATAENKKSQGFDLSDGFDMNDIMGLISKFK